MNADQLKTHMAQLPRPETDLQPPYWQAWRLNLYNWIFDNDPAQFGFCPAVYHTMLVNHWTGPIEYELNQLLNSRLVEACTLPHFGPQDTFLYGQLSMNLIHQAYHIQQWERATGRKINTLDTIVEFGGGYGAMALLCHRLGFEGKYIIYDLPEFSLLQEYYLSQFGLLANVTWPKGGERKPKDVDLFMGLYSISEVPLKDRPQAMVKANSYLFLYSGLWEGWNNVEWFRQFAMSTTLEWQHSELTHLPDANNWYSIGG